MVALSNLLIIEWALKRKGAFHIVAFVHCTEEANQWSTLKYSPLGDGGLIVSKLLPYQIQRTACFKPFDLLFIICMV
jgi:hypothetical protein